MDTMTKRNHQVGMTLVEVVVSMCLVALLLSGLLTGLLRGQQINYATAQRMAASGLCQSKIEEMKAAGYDAFIS
jgi:type II secretory pathway pseudopilin PulG